MAKSSNEETNEKVGGDEMPKELKQQIEQIEIMSGLVSEVKKIRGHDIKNRAIGDLKRIANSAWLNLYDYLSDNGIDPDKHFTSK